MYQCTSEGCPYTTNNHDRWMRHVAEEETFAHVESQLDSINQPKQSPKRFLACSSGGQRGVILTGMAKQLFLNDSKNVEWDEVAGISAGAFCAAYISQTTPKTFLGMIDRLHDGFMTKDFNVASPWIWGGAFINAIDALLFHDSLYSNDKMVKLIHAWFDPSHIQRPLHIGVYNKTTMTYETISSTDTTQDMRKACLASAAVPTMLPTVTIGKDQYEDGGMRHIIPVEEIKAWVRRTPGKKHVDVMVCYPLDGQKFTRTNIPEMKHGTASSAVRMISDMMLSQFQHDLMEIANLCDVSYDHLIANSCSIITNGDLTVRMLSPVDGMYTSLLNITPDTTDDLFKDGEKSVGLLKM